MKFFRHLIVPCLILAFGIVKSQKIDTGIFITPMDIPINLAANFGELRTNHFHTGLDIKTGGQEGVPVRSIGNGYVSRIKISPSGYGKCVYITHPNGFTSVYAHLKELKEPLASYVKNLQYGQKNFEVEAFPTKEELPLAEAQVFALSGNSGSSGGPHLHFEIRETKSEKPVNPLLFGYKVADEQAPRIRSFYLYALDDDANIGGRKKLKAPIVGTNGNYKSGTKYPIRAHGRLGLMVDAYDTFDGNYNKCGLYDVKVYTNDTLMYHANFDKLNFFTNRYLNAYTDFDLWCKGKRTVQKCFVEPHNKLENYQSLMNDGVIIPDSKENTNVRVVISDFAGNSSELTFTIEPTAPLKVEPKIAGPNEYQVYWNQDFMAKEGACAISIKSENFYNNEWIEFKPHQKYSKNISEVFSVGSSNIPIQKGVTIAISQPGIDPTKKDKVLLAEMKSDGNVNRPYTVKWNGDVASANVRYFGNFGLVMDETAPTVTLLNLPKSKTVNRGKELVFRIKDSLAGIASYNVYLNDTWLLSDYDSKYSRLGTIIDKEKVEPGTYTLKAEVTDAVGNVKLYQTEIIVR